MTCFRRCLFLMGLSLLQALPGVAQSGRDRDRAPTTRLDITSTPPGALVRINHQERGHAPLALTDLPAGPHLIHLSLPGFRDAFESVALEPGVPRSVAARLEPLTGLLLMTSNPSGSAVLVGGVSLGVTPLLITSLPSGAHRIQVASPGYQTKEIDVTLEGRTPLKKEVTLMSDSGTMDIISDPVGAEVFINGISRGHAPCRIDRIPGGAVTLELRANGFQPHTRDVSLAAGEAQQIEIRLLPLPGTLRIVSIPEGARVYINDEFRGETPYNLANTPPGDYRVRVEREGHAPNARNVTLAKGATMTEEFRLQRITGRIELVTAPAGATVLLDGRKLGVTIARGSDTTAISDIFVVEEVLQGEREIEIFRKGFASQRQKVEIKSGETQTLQFRLIRQFIPNYEVITTRSHHRGVLEFLSEEGVRLETAPGVTQTIPMRDIRRHGPIREEGN